MAEQLRKSDPFGIQRAQQPRGAFPQQADSLDASLPIAEDELLIEVESLNVDSANFKQISDACAGDLSRIEKHILELVKKRGKLHNPVTGSGGMLVGRVAQIGPAFPGGEKPLKAGDRVATLVSLSLTPLELRAIRKVHPRAMRVDVDGHAIVFASGVVARIPEDIPETVALAALDVAAVPARVRALVQENQTVTVIGAGGKSGMLALYEAKQKLGVKTVAIERSQASAEKLSSLSFVDEVIQADARDAVGVMEKVWNVTKGKMADVVINVANDAETEMACILSCKRRGSVLFFNLATQFIRATLGAEAVGADVDLLIGNGYSEGHAELVLDVLRDSPELHRVFTEAYS
jgi:L-erythro-3,5-diaminohexanoate dehydrogenase